MTDPAEPCPQAREAPDVAAGVRKWVIKSVLFLLILPVVVCACSGRADWVTGWAMVGVYVAFQSATAIVILPRCPGLLAERAGLQKGAKKWDVAIASAAAVWLPMSTLAVAGLNLRFGWPPEVPLWCRLAALGALLAGLGVAFWAMASNPFFSGVVRIQRDRGHTVQTGGPYRYVRHPGYVGAIPYVLATPIVLGSIWSLIPAAAAALLFVIRTALEDRTLHRELDGYPQYAARVRYRLLPGVW